MDTLSSARLQDEATPLSAGLRSFAELSVAALKFLSENKLSNRYRRGQVVFYAGNSPSGLYCIDSGIVRLECAGLSGKTHIVRLAGAGQFIGHRSLFANEPYEATAVVHVDAEVCLIPKAVIFRLLEDHPRVAAKILAELARDLRTVEQRLCTQSDKGAPERVAEAVLYLREGFPEQAWTRLEIAEWAGTTPETVMRSLADFEAAGWIEQRGRLIHIVNRQALARRARLAF